MEIAIALILINIGATVYLNWRAAGKVDLSRCADTILIDFYSRGGDINSEERLRAFTRVTYLDLCNRYGLPVSQEDQVARFVVDMWRPVEQSEASNIFA